MSWQGANLQLRRRHAASRDNKNQLSETTEAVLNRLSKAYATSMECVGSLYQADKAMMKDQQRMVGSIDQLIDVARTARQSFEKSLLADPLIGQHAMLLNQSLGNSRKVTITLRSEGHKSRVRQLAYLSLVNYADLLLAGLSEQKGSTMILEGRLGPSLEFVAAHGAVSCWRSSSSDDVDASINMHVLSVEKFDEEDAHTTGSIEAVAETVTKALRSYLDATSLDRSDPTVWLKVACAARQLGLLRAAEDTPRAVLKYRRLEKHALEEAQTALPPQQPPNRLALRAWKEWLEEESQLTAYPPVLCSEDIESVPPLSLELSRYSWSALGRMLLRVCKDGSPRDGTSSNVFVSPVVEINLSPLLVLPEPVLGRVCQFLESSQLWKFEATCRALSASILAARAALENKKTETVRPAETAPEEAPKKEETTAVAPSANSTKEQQQASRVSKRLRSQIITSGKRAERSSRRNSIDYCLLAATLGWTVDDEDYKSHLDIATGSKKLSNEFQSRRLSMERMSRNSHDFQGKFGDLSLSNFVETWSKRSSSLTLLLGFVAEVSMNSSRVYASDPAGSTMLTTCVLECKLLSGSTARIH